MRPGPGVGPRPGAAIITARRCSRVFFRGRRAADRACVPMPGRGARGDRRRSRTARGDGRRARGVLVFPADNSGVVAASDGGARRARAPRGSLLVVRCASARRALMSCAAMARRGFPWCSDFSNLQPRYGARTVIAMFSDLLAFLVSYRTLAAPPPAGKTAWQP